MIYRLPLSLLLCLLSCGLVLSQPHTLKGKVVAIADGDTCTVLDKAKVQHKIRLNGIDAPESGQEFGKAAKANLSKLVFGKNVTVVWTTLDRYGRKVGTITYRRKDVQLAQITAGFAWYFVKYNRNLPKEQRPIYAAAEADARTKQRGLWQAPNPVAPWEYRKQ